MNPMAKATGDSYILCFEIAGTSIAYKRKVNNGNGHALEL